MEIGRGFFSGQVSPPNSPATMGFVACIFLYQIPESLRLQICAGIVYDVVVLYIFPFEKNSLLIILQGAEARR